MAYKKWIEDFEAGALSEAEELALLRRARAHHQRQKQQVADILRNLESAEATQAKIVQFRRNLFYAAAASVFCVAIGWWITRTTPPPTPQQMFAQVAAPASPSGPLLDLHGISLDSAKQLFIEAYLQKKYADCVQFEPILASAKEDWQIALAYSHLQTGHFAQSIALLEKLYARQEQSREATRWWLGLSYGLAGDSTKMRQYLREIAAKQFHYEDAQLLLK
jgi:hypothetical protein